MTDNKIAEILETFKIFDSKYKKEQVDAAIELKDEIIPHLLGILENMLADPSKYLGDIHYYDHIYALMLLGHFKEQKTHKILIDLMSVHGDIIHKIFEYTDEFPIVLVRTCGGSLDLIKALALNKNINEFCRIDALQSMVYAVADGIEEREEVLSIYGSLFTGKEAGKYSDFWGLLAEFVCKLYPEELMQTIDKAYKDRLISQDLMQYEDFEEALADGKEMCLDRIKIDFQLKSLDDLHLIMPFRNKFSMGEDLF